MKKGAGTSDRRKTKILDGHETIHGQQRRSYKSHVDLDEGDSFVSLNLLDRIRQIRTNPDIVSEYTIDDQNDKQRAFRYPDWMDPIPALASQTFIWL